MEQICIQNPALSPSSVSRLYSTRFQGSKRRMLEWLLSIVSTEVPQPGLALDAFAGSGVVTYGLAQLGWNVIASDRLLATESAVVAFCADSRPLNRHELEAFARLSETESSGWLFEMYSGRLYPDSELHWLDNAVDLVAKLPYEAKHVALWALCQSALAKRPYNLFHRANLDMRLRDVPRTFGNKATWEKPFAEHVARFAVECARFQLSTSRAVFSAGDPRSVRRQPVQLLYLDPPYINRRRVVTPYNDYYSFLDFICDPSTRQSVDTSRPHRPRLWESSDWERPDSLLAAMDELIRNNPGSVVIVSYRTDGYPSVEAIVDVVASRRRRTSISEAPIKYALSKNVTSKEAVIVGKP